MDSPCVGECAERKILEDMLQIWRTNTVAPYVSNEDVDIPPDSGITHISQSADPIINNLWEKYIEYRNKTLNIEVIKSYKQKLLSEDSLSVAYTNDRKVAYEEWARERLVTIGNVLRVVYVVLVILYLYYGPFVKNDWKTANGWIIPIILIILPFVIPYIVITLRLFYNKILWLISNKIYRNVYV
jgi:hypothetical protein